MKTPLESRASPAMMTGSEGAQREQNAGHGAENGSADAGAQADAGDEKAGGGRDHEADQVDEEQRTERGGRRLKGAAVRWKVIQVKTPTSEKSTLKPTAKVATRRRLRNSALHLARRSARRETAAAGGAARRRPRGSQAATAAAPARAAVPSARKLTRQLNQSARIARRDAAEEAAQRGSADIETHDQRRRARAATPRRCR